MRVHPQPSPLRPRFLLRERIALTVLRCFLLRVRLVVPREARGSLREARVQCLGATRVHIGARTCRRDHHLAHDAPVAVVFVYSTATVLPYTR